MMTFYRAVSAAEGADISRRGVLRVIEGGVEGKFLTNTVASAQKWGELLHKGAAQIAEVSVPKATARALDYLGRIDGAGEAWFARVEQLKGVTARLLKK
jgi:hypothetical protein